MEICQKELCDMMSQSPEGSIYGFKCNHSEKAGAYPAAYPGRALCMAGNSLLAQLSQKIKKKEKNPKKKGRTVRVILAVFSMCRNRITESCLFLVWVSEENMAFFTSAISILKTLVVAIGAGLAVWGVINLLEGYGNDNPGAKSQGIKQLMAGGGVVLIGTQLVPLLANLFG